jgi:hypothetical protein
MTSYMAEPFTQALEEAINHDLNPRAMSPKVKGFRPAQSWFQDFTSVYMDGAEAFRRGVMVAAPTMRRVRQGLLLVASGLSVAVPRPASSEPAVPAAAFDPVAAIRHQSYA